MRFLGTTFQATLSNNLGTEKQIKEVEQRVEELSDYEKVRLKNMKERQALLEELDMDKEAVLLLHSGLPLYNGQEDVLPLLHVAVNMGIADLR